jgi:shikimate kinase
MQPRQNIVLVGFMGTGKTSVGKAVAAQLGSTFVDMDDILEQRAGKPISRVFAEDGEPYFRARESELVKELAAQSGLVIATGGGIVLDPENVRIFAESGLVVCLWATPEEILRRVAHETHRPLLASGDKMERIATLLAKRRPLYEAIPCRVDTTQLSVAQVVQAVLAIFVQYRHGVADEQRKR